MTGVCLDYKVCLSCNDFAGHNDCHWCSLYPHLSFKCLLFSKAQSWQTPQHQHSSPRKPVRRLSRWHVQMLKTSVAQQGTLFPLCLSCRRPRLRRPSTNLRHQMRDMWTTLPHLPEKRNFLKAWKSSTTLSQSAGRVSLDHYILRPSGFLSQIFISIDPEVAGLRTTKQQRKIRHERSSHPEQVSTTRVPVAETSTENGSGATNKSKGRSGSQRCTNSSSQGVAAKETNDKPPQHQQQNQHASGQSKRYEAMHLFRALSPRARDKQRVRDAEEQNSSSHCFEAEEAVRPGESLRDRCRRLSNQVEIQHIEDIEDETREAQEYAPPEQSTSELPRRNSSSLRPTWPGVFLWGRQVGQATFPKAEP